jgi:lysozyme family protein
MTDLAKLRADNERRWSVVRLTRPFSAISDQLIAAKSRYLAVEAKTGVPWFVIAVIHMRESSRSFLGVLHNGERIIGTNRQTRLVPKGRGPFATWEEAAVDALVNCAPYAARNKDWSIGGTLTMLEQYNGLGYAAKGLPSPYVWAGTDQYVKGKYVADGKFDPNAVDAQPGCAGMILAIMAADASVKFGEVAAPTRPLEPAPPVMPGPEPGIAPPKAGTEPQPPPSAWAAFFMAIISIFKRAA